MRVRDADGAVTGWADATFETGVSEWHAQWITHPESDKKQPRTLYFRTEVDLPAPVVRARADATALGWYRLFVNDTNVTGKALVPRWTPFHDYAEYQAYDITGALRAGSNRIGIVVLEGRMSTRAFSETAHGSDLRRPQRRDRSTSFGTPLHRHLELTDDDIDTPPQSPGFGQPRVLAIPAEVDPCNA